MKSPWFSSGVHNRVYKYMGMCDTQSAQAVVRHKEASVILLTSTLCVKAVTKPEIRPNIYKSHTFSHCVLLCQKMQKNRALF